MSNKDNQTVWNKHRNFIRFYTVKVLVTFQGYSDSRPWLWTSDFDCYSSTEWHMPIIAYRLLLAEFTL